MYKIIIVIILIVQLLLRIIECAVSEFTTVDQRCHDIGTPHPLAEYSKQMLLIAKIVESKNDSKQLATQYSKYNQDKSMIKDLLKTLNLTMVQLVFGEEARRKVALQMKTDKSWDELYNVSAQCPSGQVRRGESFFRKPGVHLPSRELIVISQNFLEITDDFMQTAVNAFAIFVYGSVHDIYRLPPQYVLRSARTIAMLQLSREKLTAIWNVVKQLHRTGDVTYAILEQYRPLFKYLSGREISKLNLRDERILYYVGTHMELSRHQVGIVASHYIKLNPDWRKPKYLNLMNNIICGIAIPLMRNVPDSTYLQLNSQVFSHMRACDPLHKRYYLGKMTKSQVYGKSYSWSARDVAHLGLLIAELRGPELSAIKPSSMAGITPHVLHKIPIESLLHIRDDHIRYLSHRCKSILAKKLKASDDDITLMDAASSTAIHTYIYLIPVIIKINT